MGTQVSVLMARAAGPALHRGKVGVVPRRPQARAFSSGVLAHSKACQPLSLASACTVSACSRTPLASRGTHQQHRLLAQIQLAVGVDHAHAVGVDQLHARDGYSSWMVAITVHRGLDAGEGADGAPTALGQGCRRRVTSVKMPSVPSLPTNRRVRS